MHVGPSTQPTLRGIDATGRRIALALLGVGLLLRLPLVSGDQGWFDEYFTLATASLPISDIIAVARTEQTNPPGYYLAAAAWERLGAGNLAAQRLPLVVAGALAPALLVIAIRRLGFSALAAATGGLLATVSPLLWLMSLEVRAYSLLALLASCSLVIAAGFADAHHNRRGASVPLLAAIHVLMVFTHFFGAFTVLGNSLAATVLRARRQDLSPGDQLRMFAVLTLPAALLLAAWLAYAFGSGPGMRLQNTIWIPPVSALEALRSIPALLLANLGPLNGLASAALLLGGAALAVRAARRERLETRVGGPGEFVILAAAVPPLAALLVHLLSPRDLWVARYLTASALGLALLPAVVVDATPPTLRRGLALCIVLWWSTAGALRVADRQRKPDWSAILSHLAPQGRGTICVRGRFVGLPMFYLAAQSGAPGLRVLDEASCNPEGLTWLVYDVRYPRRSRLGDTSTLRLGTRVVLSRGWQNLDARRVLANPTPRGP